MELDNSKQFIVDTLKQKGACDVTSLLESCKSKANCPKVLKVTNTNALKSFLEKQTDFFSFKNDKVCSVEFEKNYFHALLKAVQKEGSFSLDNAVDQLKDCDRSTVNYIQALGNAVGVEEFLNRNSDSFEIRDRRIYAKTQGLITEKDDKAVKYFLDILLKKGELKLKTLCGHLNQAPPEVKSIVKSTNPTVFREFLNKNSYFFEINGDVVRKRDSAANNLSILVEGDDSLCRTVEYFIGKLSSKGGNLTLQQLVSFVNHDKDPEIIGTVGSGKLGDIDNFLSLHPTIFTLDDNMVSLLLQQTKLSQSITVVKASDSISISNHIHNLVANSTNQNNAGMFVEGPKVNTNSCTKEQTTSAFLTSPSKNSFFDTPEPFAADFKEAKEIFTNLFGSGFYKSLSSLLSSLRLKDAKNVELLWFDVGRKPFVKILIDNPTMKFEIHELSDQPEATENFLDSIIKKLLKVSPTVCGMKGHLHTFRINLFQETPVGITMFHQVHTSNTGRFEEKIDGNLRVIFYDCIRTSSNDFYSYLRMICERHSRHYHVVIVDFNGKIAGYSYALPAVVGKSRCISCYSAENRSKSLHEAVSHSPDFIVTNCLDIMDSEMFNLLQAVAKQGIQVVATLSHQYKDSLP